MAFTSITFKNAQQTHSPRKEIASKQRPTPELEALLLEATDMYTSRYICRGGVWAGGWTGGWGVEGQGGGGYETQEGTPPVFFSSKLLNVFWHAFNACEYLVSHLMSFV